MATMRPFSFPDLAIIITLGILTVGCGGGDSDPEGSRSQSDARPEETAAEPEVWSLSEVPLLEIGVREGEDAYQLFRASSSTRLPDGRIAVANSGTQEIRFYDSTGVYLGAVGGDGEGPGEFRYPTRIRPAGGDTLMVWDQRLYRISFLDRQGVFLSSGSLNPTRDNMFPGDDWLFGSYLVDSPVPPEARGPIQRAIERMPPRDPRAGLAFLRVTPQGRIWATERHPPADTVLLWKVYDLEGRQVARVANPPRFEPHEIGPDYVLGRFQDEWDVNYIRLFALEKPEGSPPGPGLNPGVAEDAGGQTHERQIAPDEVIAGVKSVLKDLASLEEIFYSQSYTYTTNTEELFGGGRNRLPDGILVNILFANDKGWMGTVTHEETGYFCALTYGAFVPMGWRNGQLVCP